MKRVRVDDVRFTAGLLGMNDAARYLGIPRQTFHRWAHGYERGAPLLHVLDPDSPELSPRSLASVSKTFVPPPASSWAAPPEFYLDENSVSRSVFRFLGNLGYAVHTPGELFGSREAAHGPPDTEWLGRVAGTGWAVIGRDAKIAERPHELTA
jgi:hypothetical protein